MKRKVYINPGDMVEVHIVHPAFEPNASGAREQTHRSSILFGFVNYTEFAVSDLMARQVSWDELVKANKERGKYE